MNPFLLRPAYKDYLWGGTRLKTEFGKQTNLATVAESWELSAHPNGSSVVAEGELAGTTLAELFSIHRELFGASCERLDKFPILIKFIDAAKSLSIQVHPDDAYAMRHDGESGKTEMWVIVEHEPEAYLYIGLTREVSRAEMERSIADGTLEQVLQKVPVKKGDVFFLRPGTIHAIGAGIVLAEVQQNSDSTYRMYDFGRLGTDGKPRPLHIRQALDVARLAPSGYDAPKSGMLQETEDYTLRQLADCSCFTVRQLRLNGRFSMPPDGSGFLSLLCLDGKAELISEQAALPVQKGDSVFVSADNPSFELQGGGEFLLTGYGCGQTNTNMEGSAT